MTTVSSGVGALYGSIPTLGAGTAAGAIAGATTGFLGYAGSIAYKNRRDFVEGYKKVSELEDPMGRCHP